MSKPACAATDNGSSNSGPSITNPQSSIVNRKSSPQPRKIHPILSRLTPDQKQQLITLYEQHSSLDATRLAHEKLGIQISSGTLSRLYSTWQIAEDNDTRQDLEAAHNSSIEELTEKQLQLRLLEQASRPNMDHTELRAVCQSFARLQSVKLSARRVQLAESKEARLAQNSEPERDFSYEETIGGLRVMLGRDPDDDRDYSGEYDATPAHLHDDAANQNCRRRGDESLSNSAPETPSNPQSFDEVGRVAPRAPRTDETLANNQNESSVHTAPTDHSPNEKCSLLTAHCSMNPPTNSVLSVNSVSIPQPPGHPPLSTAPTAEPAAAPAVEPAATVAPFPASATITPNVAA